MSQQQAHCQVGWQQQSRHVARAPQLGPMAACPITSQPPDLPALPAPPPASAAARRARHPAGQKQQAEHQHWAQPQLQTHPCLLMASPHWHSTATFFLTAPTTLSALKPCHQQLFKPTQQPPPSTCRPLHANSSPHPAAPNPSLYTHRLAGTIKQQAAGKPNSRDVGNDSSLFKGATECPEIQLRTHCLASRVTRLNRPIKACRQAGESFECSQPEFTR